MRDMVTVCIDLTGIIERNIDLKTPLVTQNIDKTGVLNDQDMIFSQLTVF